MQAYGEAERCRYVVMITQRSVDECRNACDPGVVGRDGDTGLDMNKKSRNPKRLRRRC